LLPNVTALFKEPLITLNMGSKRIYRTEAGVLQK